VFAHRQHSRARARLFGRVRRSVRSRECARVRARSRTRLCARIVQSGPFARGFLDKFGIDGNSIHGGLSAVSANLSLVLRIVGV